MQKPPCCHVAARCWLGTATTAHVARPPRILGALIRRRFLLNQAGLIRKLPQWLSIPHVRSRRPNAHCGGHNFAQILFTYAAGCLNSQAVEESRNISCECLAISLFRQDIYPLELVFSETYREPTVFWHAYPRRDECYCAPDEPSLAAKWRSTEVVSKWLACRGTFAVTIAVECHACRGDEFTQRRRGPEKLRLRRVLRCRARPSFGVAEQAGSSPSERILNRSTFDEECLTSTSCWNFSIRAGLSEDTSQSPRTSAAQALTARRRRHLQWQPRRRRQFGRSEYAMNYNPLG